MRNPILFQGERELKKKRSYFEGWYFKNTNGTYSISFIPGINISKNDKKAFIQVITNDSSYFVNYDIDKFEYGYEPFYVKIGDNFFSKDKIYIDIKDESNNLFINGNLKYSDNKNINTNFFSPNIMGIFSYIPLMECNHAINSMKNKVNGSININDVVIKFDNGIGYIEKDWGYSFPKSYIWCQGNNFINTNASFMLSIANIPFKILEFKGIICDLIIDDKEYKFTTYNNTKLAHYDITDNKLNITLKKGNYFLNISSNYDDNFRLLAPIKGKMEKGIFESISSVITITLKRNDEIIFTDTSKNCGLEIVCE